MMPAGFSIFPFLQQSTPIFLTSVEIPSELFAGENRIRLQEGVGISYAKLFEDNLTLAKVFDTTNIQLVYPSQLNQFIAACHIAAVQPSVRNVPSVILCAMQSNGESLLAKFRQSVLEFWND
jgi:hypothetical protein